MEATKRMLNLVCRDVDKYYSNQTVFKQFNLESSAEHLVIEGRNGSGKTTLLCMIAGIEAPNKGHVSWQGNDVSSIATKRRVGMSASCIALPEFLSVKQVLEFHCRHYECQFPTALIDQISLSPFLAQRVDALSLGTTKKLSLVLAFAHSPALLILDEPSNGLDEQALSTLMNWMESFDGNMIIATHDQSFYQNLDAEVINLSEHL